MMKIMSMTAGDFSFDAVFRRSLSGESEDAQDILFPPISYILWIIFVILMPILFTNMLVNINAICMLNFCEFTLHLACELYVIFLFRNQRFCIAHGYVLCKDVDVQSPESTACNGGICRGKVGASWVTLQ